MDFVIRRFVIFIFFLSVFLHGIGPFALVRSAKAAQPKQAFDIYDLNVAMARVYGLDFVPGIDQRINPLAKEIAIRINASRDRKKGAFFVFQEMFAKPAQKAVIDVAQALNLSVSFPAPRSGLMILSTYPLVSDRFFRFKDTSIGRPFGVSEAVFQINPGNPRNPDNQFAIWDVHTVFSPKEAPNPMHLSQLNKTAIIMREYARKAGALVGDFNVGPDTEVPGQLYNPAREIWKEGVLDQLGKGFRWIGHYSSTGNRLVTWDSDLNPLILYPVRWVKWAGMVDEVRNDGGGLESIWMHSPSQIDHIILTPAAAERFEITNVDLAFHHPVEIRGLESHYYLPGRLKRSFVSDHFGCVAALEEK